MPRDMQSWGFPPTTVSYCELQTLRRNLALAPSAERPGRHGGSLAAADELWPALHVGRSRDERVFGSYECQRASSCALHATRARCVRA
jgi:hypothetical protein